MGLSAAACAVATVFDPLTAPSLETRPERVQLALLAIAVVAAVQALGNLLVLALLVAPAAAAPRLGRSVRAQLLLSAALGSTAGVLGMVASAELDVAARAAVALAAVAIFVAAAIARPGLSSRGARRRRSPVEALRGSG